MHFFGALSHVKLVYTGAEGVLGKISGSVGKSRFLKKYQRGDSFNRQGVEYLRKGASLLPTPRLTPKSAPDQLYYADLL